MRKTKWVFLIFLFLTYSEVSAQVKIYEVKLSQMKSSLDKINYKSPINKSVKKGIGNFLLNIYQKHISVQISADCLYSLSCSRYSREVVNTRGLFMGVMLSADRLTRCSAFCANDIPQFKYNDEGLVEDLP